MDLNKKLEKLKPYQLNCNVFDVYSYNGLTMQDLLCQFFTKINECITVSNETIDLAKWLVNEGLEIEVVKKLMIWLEDGTLENIINVNLFNTLNEKINGLSSQLEHNTKISLKTFYNVDKMKADEKIKIGDIVDTLNYYDDGGGARYEIIENTLVDGQDSYYEGLNFITLNNGLQAKLMIENKFTLKQVGLRFNDEESKEFNTSAFVKAIEIMCSGYDLIVDKGILYLQECYIELNKYSLTSDVSVGGANKYIPSIIGCGMFDSVLCVDNTDNCKGLFYTNNITTVLSGLKIKDLAIKNSQNRLSKAISFKKAIPNLELKNILINNFHDGIYLNTWVSNVNGITVSNCYNGFTFYGTSTNVNNTYALGCTNGYLLGVSCLDDLYKNEIVDFTYSFLSSIACDGVVNPYIIGMTRGVEINSLCSESENLKQVFLFPDIPRNTLSTISINNYNYHFTTIPIDFVSVFNFKNTSDIDVNVSNLSLTSDMTIEFVKGLENSMSTLTFDNVKTNLKWDTNVLKANSVNGAFISKKMIGQLNANYNNYFTLGGSNLSQNINTIIEVNGIQSIVIPIKKTNFEKYFLYLKAKFFSVVTSETWNTVNESNNMCFGELMVSLSGGRTTHLDEKLNFKTIKNGSLDNLNVDIVKNENNEYELIINFANGNESHVYGVDIDVITSKGPTDKKLKNIYIK